MFVYKQTKRGVIMNYSCDVFWRAQIEDMVRGYIFCEENAVFLCLICGKSFEKGVIYSKGKELFDAEKAVRSHILDEHGGIFRSLVEMDRKYTGLSEIQQSILKAFHEGKGDSEIAREMDIEKSTVRNHRFKMRERTKQAKVFLALMEIAEKKQKDSEKFVEMHKNARMVDERYAITMEEEKKLLKKYFRENGKLDRYPIKAKDQIVVLRKVVTLFEAGEKYSEKEVNAIIEGIFEDYAILRRNLIEHGFMKRKADGSEYWIVF